MVLLMLWHDFHSILAIWPLVGLLICIWASADLDCRLQQNLGLDHLRHMFSQKSGFRGPIVKNGEWVRYM